MQTINARQPVEGDPKRPKSLKQHTLEHSSQSPEARERRELLVRQLMAEGCDEDEAEEVLRLTVA